MCMYTITIVCNVGEITDAMNIIANDPVERSRLRTLSLARARELSWSKTGLSAREAIQNYQKIGFE